jgi:hypothetical protein
MRKREKDSLTDDWQKKGVHFFGKGCCKKCTGIKQQRKMRSEKGLSEVEVPVFFVKGNYFGTPLYAMCWINEGGDKEQL